MSARQRRPNKRPPRVAGRDRVNAESPRLTKKTSRKKIADGSTEAAAQTSVPQPSARADDVVPAETTATPESTLSSEATQSSTATETLGASADADASSETSGASEATAEASSATGETSHTSDAATRDSVDAFTPVDGDESASPEASTPPTGDDTDAIDEARGAPAAAPRGKRPPAARVSTIKPQPNAARTAAVPTQRPPRTSKLRNRAGWPLVAAVAGIAAVFGIVAGVSAAEPGLSLGSNTAYIDSGTTSQVASQLKSRVCSIFAVDYTKLDEWQKKAASNLTGDARSKFDQLAEKSKELIGQTQTSGGVDCRIDTVGVSSIEGDRAIALANVVISQTQDGQAVGSGTKRYQISMQRVNGQWLISNFSDF